ncbi:19592_t:CDS:2, partial [Racocetra fulgida]
RETSRTSNASIRHFFSKVILEVEGYMLQSKLLVFQEDPIQYQLCSLERHPILKEGTTPPPSCITAKRPQDQCEERHPMPLRGTTPHAFKRNDTPSGCTIS